jgi:hypothetical protein
MDTGVARRQQVADVVQIAMNQSVEVLGDDLAEGGDTDVAHPLAND